jgi:hypothetical protein
MKHKKATANAHALRIQQTIAQKTRDHGVHNRSVLFEYLPLFFE